MEQAKQLELIDRLLGHLDRGTTASADAVRGAEISVYSDQALLAKEKQRFFREWPLVAAMTADIPNTGDFLTQDFMGAPVLLVRGRDGVARSFLNVCRHRGAKVESDRCGSRKLFSCPFHAWGYNTQGDLVGIPHRETFGDLDMSVLGLTPLPTVERYGLIWLRLEANGATFDVDTFLGGLAAELDAWNLSEASIIGRDRFENEMNWKLAVDTFGETYHFEILHKKTVNQGYFSNTQLYDTFGRNHRMVFAGRNLRDLVNEPRENWQLRPNSLLAYYLFPNTQLLIQRGGVSLFRIFPIGDDPHKCVTELGYYADKKPATLDDAVLAKAAFERTRDVIRLEDYPMAEMAQRSLSSGAHRYAVFGRNEPALHHYHSTYRDALEMPPLATLDVNRADG